MSDDPEPSPPWAFCRKCYSPIRVVELRASTLRGEPTGRSQEFIAAKTYSLGSISFCPVHGLGCPI